MCVYTREVLDLTRATCKTFGIGAHQHTIYHLKTLSRTDGSSTNKSSGPFESMANANNHPQGDSTFKYQ